MDRATLQHSPAAPFLRRLLRDAAEAVGADEATLWVPSADETQLDVALNHGPTSAVMETLSVPIDDSVVGLVLSSARAVCIGPDDHHNPSIDAATGTVTRAMAAAPVLMGQALIGVLSAINPRDARLFDHHDLDELTWRAYLAGLIVNDTRDDGATVVFGPA